MWFYGSMFEKGHGIKQDENKTLYYYKMSADLQNSQGMRRYAFMLKACRGIEKDLELTKKYCKIAKGAEKIEDKIDFFFIASF
ncbi:hypothetical protein TRFO_37910 [Tritrichomonas foetus]|uniref:Sel1 repeat family protein n=1 Tax=Tritrichomonas foetus TaxID=1144522 RepID=A0A1J4JA06_9EUKA|nr:hypothetical protein TRFO_38771 [Tritrichomonas foetus]OHS95966.1 hypothetical protein TRFO_37910 [Tritrichomonas foetus]|eukprot:OHS95055.1 hypothetical protein TRFO_38771 [Tritrichomonas foetus]